MKAHQRGVYCRTWQVLERQPGTRWQDAKEQAEREAALEEDRWQARVLRSIAKNKAAEEPEGEGGERS